MDVSLRPFRSADRPAWDALWQGYQQFYKVELPSEATEATWRRILDGEGPVRGLGAFAGERMIGLVHYVFHATTWASAETCYLQDLFVVPDWRGKGAARNLIEAVYAAADAAGATQVYWLTHHTNAEGRRLYDRLATNSGFIVYERPGQTSE